MAAENSYAFLRDGLFLFILLEQASSPRGDGLEGQQAVHEDVIVVIVVNVILRVQRRGILRHSSSGIFTCACVVAIVRENGDV